MYMWQELPPEQPGEHVACHMRLVKMVARSLTYDHKRVLSSFYDKRMTSSGVDMRETILRKSPNCGTEWKIRIATTPTNVHRTLTIRQVFEHERGKLFVSLCLSGLFLKRLEKCESSLTFVGVVAIWIF